MAARSPSCRRTDRPPRPVGRATRGSGRYRDDLALIDPVDLMNWREIPSAVVIGRNTWSVRWRSHDDADWARRGSDLLGLCEFQTRTIHLDERLKYNPTDLCVTWI